MVHLDVIFLAGGPRRSPLEQALGWPLHCFPISREQTLLDEWMVVVEQAVARSASFTLNSARLVLSAAVAGAENHRSPSIDVVIEPRMHRGTAGVVQDVLADGGDQSAVLVVELSSSPVVQLVNLLRAWHPDKGHGARCVLGESALGRYCGVALCDRSAFDLVPRVGFVDFKEQFLPMLTASGGKIDSVVVANRARRVGTHREWLAAAGVVNVLGGLAEPSAAGVLELDDRANLIRPGAITTGATILSSIIMDDVVVAPGVLVARSIIGPGVAVKAGSRLIDSVVGDPGAAAKILARLHTRRDKRVES